MDEVELHGGVANAGAVTRRGAHVLRPANAHTSSVHRFLRAIADAGFDGASVPDGVEPDGRERLTFIDGDVPIVPYPDWAQSDAALASVAALMRRYHDAARAHEPRSDDSWSDEMADPVGGTVVVHNDVCLENVVFRHGRAVGLLDFDFAAPGRPVFDLACFARMCVPVDDPSRTRFGWRSVDADLPRRLRLVADAYGLEPDDRSELLSCLDDSIARGGQFVLRRVEAGDPNFIAMWESFGGLARFDTRRAWWAKARPNFAAALLSR